MNPEFRSSLKRKKEILKNVQRVLLSLLFISMNLVVFSQKSGVENSVSGKSGYKIEGNQSLKNIERIGDSLNEIDRFTSIRCYEFLLDNVSDTKTRIRIYEKLTAVHENLYDYDNALLNAFKLLKLCYETNDTLKIGQTHSRIGSLFSNKKDHKEALHHFELALKIAVKLKSEKGIAAIKSNMADSYFSSGKKDIAFRSVRQALAMNQKSGNVAWIGINYIELADFHYEMNDLDSFYYYVILAKDAFDVEGDLIDSVHISRKLGMYHLKKKNYSEAEKRFLYCIEKSKELESVKLQAIHCFWLSECYEGLGKGDLALHYFKEGHLFEDSLKKMQKLDLVQGLKISQELDSLELEYKQSLAEKEKTEQNLKAKRKRLFYSYLIIGILILSSFIILFLLRKKIAANKMLLKLNKKGMKEYGKTKYSDSNLTQTQKDSILAGFVDLMDTDRLYMNPNLRLEDVAEKLDTSRSYLSQVINEHYNENFNHVINGFRVYLAKEFLINPEYDKYSLSGISEMVGFNSFSVFNSSFKKSTGLTPGYFRKNR